MYRPRASEEDVARWRDIVAEGEKQVGSRKKWLDENRISTWQYYSWRKRFRQEDGFEDPEDDAAGGHGFFEMNLSSTGTDRAGQQVGSFESSLLIQVGRYQLLVGDGIKEGTLGTVLKVLGNA